MGHLGRVYRGLGDTQKAKALLEKNLVVFEKHYGKDHLENAPIIRDLGKVYLTEGNQEAAEKLFNHSLQIYENYTHCERYSALECLGDLYHEKSKQAANKEQANLYKEKAANYLKQALHVLQTHFPNHSPHMIRVQNKAVLLKKQ